MLIDEGNLRERNQTLVTRDGYILLLILYVNNILHQPLENLQKQFLQKSRHPFAVILNIIFFCIKPGILHISRSYFTKI